MVGIYMDHFTPKTLAQRVSWALKSIDQINDDLAANLGVNKNTVMAYKKGKGDLKGVVLEKLVELYDFNAAWLLSGSGNPKKEDPKLKTDSAREQETTYTADQLKEPIVLSHSKPSVAAQETPLEHVDPDSLSATENRLVRMFRRLPPERRQTIYNIVVEQFIDSTAK